MSKQHNKILFSLCIGNEKSAFTNVPVIITMFSFSPKNLKKGVLCLFNDDANKQEIKNSNFSLKIDPQEVRSEE